MIFVSLDPMEFSFHSFVQNKTDSSPDKQETRKIWVYIDSLRTVYRIYLRLPPCEKFVSIGIARKFSLCVDCDFPESVRLDRYLKFEN